MPWGSADTGSTADEEECRRHSQGSALPHERGGPRQRGGFLEQRGVVGDEDERAETDLVAQRQTTTRNHVDEERKTATSPEVAKVPARWWTPTVVGVSLTVEVGGM